MAEIWKDIPGYEGLYQVSDTGKVRHLPRVTQDGRQVGMRMLRRQRSDKYGHKIVALADREGNVSRRFVHRLVLLAFVGPCPEGLEVCHNDGRGWNNRLENLRYDTRSSNQIDCVKQGKNNFAKLNEESVRAIRKGFEEGVSAINLGKQFGVSREAIYNVVKRKTYDWIK